MTPPQTALAAVVVVLLAALLVMRRREAARTLRQPDLKIHPYLAPEGNSRPERYCLLIKNEGLGSASRIAGTITYTDMDGDEQTLHIFTRGVRLEAGECILKKGIFPRQHPPAGTVLVALEWRNRFDDPFNEAILLAPQRFEPVKHADLYFSNIVMEI